jgi:acyl-CoA thioesterase YciA
MTTAAETSQPRGELALRTVAMPADTNPAGDIFGGWIMFQMDLGAGLAGTARAHGRVATVAATHFVFLQPVHVGDAVCCFTELLRTGRTSLTYGVEVWAQRGRHGTMVKVTAAEFTMVAVDEQGRPRPLPPA